MTLISWLCHLSIECKFSWHLGLLGLRRNDTFILDAFENFVAVDTCPGIVDVAGNHQLVELCMLLKIGEIAIDGLSVADKCVLHHLSHCCFLIFPPKSVHAFYG